VVSSKEPYISSKEPYISSKEPYSSAKEPYEERQRSANSVLRDEGENKRALYLHKRAL